MTKTLPQIAHEYAEQNPNVSVELAFLEGMIYHSKQEAEKVEQRKTRFKQELSLYVSKYGASMITDFYEYWSEMNKGGTKMKFEKEKTWELSKRLKRWSDNNKKYNGRSKSVLQIGQIVNDTQSEEILFKANF